MHLDTSGQDLRLALRSIARNPGLSITVALTFALGVGANAAVYSLIEPLLLRTPSGVAQARSVRRLYHLSGTAAGASFSGASYTAIREALSGLANVSPKLFADSATLAAGQATIPVERELATSGYLPLLTGAPALGRYFTAEEGDAAAPVPRMVLSHRLWQRSFGGDSGVLGRELRIGETPYLVVGVAPKDFAGVDVTPVDVWTTATYLGQLPEPWYRSTNEKLASLILRIGPGADERQVEVRGTGAYRRTMAAAASADSLRTLVGSSLIEGRGPLASRELRVSTRVAGVALIVLLVACANIATLVLVRAVGRRREIATRLALGASRARIIAQMLVETLLMALIGGVAALVVAGLGGSMLRRVLLPDVGFSGGVLGWRVVLGILLVSVLGGLLSGVVPAAQASHPDLVGALRSTSNDGSRHGARLRAALLVAQTALSVVLIVGAGLFLRSLGKLHAIDLGITPDRTIIVSLRDDGPPPHADLQTALGQIAERVGATPGVQAVALATAAPFVKWTTSSAFLAGQDTSVSLDGEKPGLIGIDSSFFAAMGTRVVMGRGIVPADRLGSESVVFVGETMAKALWPGVNPLGKCLIPFAATGACHTVVGVVNDLHQWALVEEPRFRFFIPIEQIPADQRQPGIVVVRVDPRQAFAVADLIRAEVRRDLPTVRVMWPIVPMAERLESQFRPWVVGTALFLSLGILALVVAAIGVYSVMAHSVHQRTREIGIRIAVGARATDLLETVLLKAARSVGAGVAIGIGLALVLGRFIASQLYDVSSRDPATLVGSAALLLGAGALATMIPALRATRVDPVTVLRDE